MNTYFKEEELNEFKRITISAFNKYNSWLDYYILEQKELLMQKIRKLSK